jgi:hypothetical protein
MVYGLIVFCIGIIPFTIGGLIAAARHPRLFDNDNNAKLGLKVGDPPKDDKFKSYGEARFRDPVAKWFTRIGFALCLAGMAVIVISSALQHNSDGKAKISIRIPL